MRTMKLLMIACCVVAGLQPPHTKAEDTCESWDFDQTFRWYLWLIDNGEMIAAKKLYPTICTLLERRALSTDRQSDYVLSTYDYEMGFPANLLIEPDEDDSINLAEKLTERISLDFDAVPLGDVLKQIAEDGGFDIVGGKAHWLEPVSIHVAEIRTKSALNLLLTPLGLQSNIDDEFGILKISAIPPPKPPSTRTYFVGDLLVPVEHLTPDATPPKLFDVEYLSDVVKSAGEPESWQEAAGEGWFKPGELRGTVVVHQSDQTHQWLQEAFSGLRDARREMELDLLYIEAAGFNVFHDHDLAIENGTLTLSAAQFTALETSLSSDSRYRTRKVPDLTLYSDQTGTVEYDESRPPALITPFLSEDRQSVRLNVAAPKRLKIGEIMAATQTLRLSDGETALFWLEPGRLDREPLRHEGIGYEWYQILAITPHVVIYSEQ